MEDSAGGGPGSVYRVLQKGVVRAGFDKDSDKTGQQLEPGDKITAIETRVNDSGQLRVNFEGGWVSLAAASGKALLELVVTNTINNGTESSGDDNSEVTLSTEDEQDEDDMQQEEGKDGVSTATAKLNQSVVRGVKGLTPLVDTSSKDWHNGVKLFNEESARKVHGANATAVAAVQGASLPLSSSSLLLFYFDAELTQLGDLGWWWSLLTGD